ncbi:AraC family transcriptional regulator, partial [Piscinibacter sp.]|uniref:AraC family transcriptional regulator n=1 Tax=Piscinibacter sp. TaxID=1903157 RepID=UPI002C71C7F2
HRVHHSAGTVTFVPAGHSVKWFMDSPREMVHVHLYVPPQLLPGGSAGATRDDASNETPGLIGVTDPWISHYMNLLLSEVASCARTGTLGDSCFLRQTGPMVLRHLSASSAPRSVRHRPRISPLRSALLARIEQFVGEHLAADIPLEALAAIASMSVDHFVRAFHQATGTTPHHYLVERRLEHGCTLLRDSSLPIADVAKACGFASPAHFSAMFHRRHGLSPSWYRRL